LHESRPSMQLYPDVQPGKMKDDSHAKAVEYISRYNV